MLSKSRGQVLRIATILHMLFAMNDDESPEPDELSTEVSEQAIKAAINFVKTACEHASLIAGGGSIQEEIDKFQSGA